MFEIFGEWFSISENTFKRSQGRRAGSGTAKAAGWDIIREWGGRTPETRFSPIQDESAVTKMRGSH